MSFTGSKVITNGTSSWPFVVRVTCVVDGVPVSEDLTYTGDGTETTGDFEMERGGAAIPVAGDPTFTG